MIEKIKTFLKTDQGKRTIYEVQSFAMTFGAALVGLVGFDKFTSLDVIITNQEVIIGSLTTALSRTVIIYGLAALGIANYRRTTKEYK